MDELTEVSIARDDRVGHDLLEILAPVRPEAMAQLRRYANAGDRDALRSLLVAGSDAQEDYLQLGAAAADVVESRLRAASGQDGAPRLVMDLTDPLRDLVLSALKSSATDLWDAAAGALEAGTLHPHALEGAVRALASNYSEIPLPIQTRLAILAPNLKAAKIARDDGAESFEAARTELEMAADVLDEGEAEERLLALMRTDPAGFAHAARIWDSANKYAFLCAMSMHSEAEVRATAVYALIEHCTRRPELVPSTTSALRAAMAVERGAKVPNYAALALSHSGSTAFPELYDALSHHASAFVRNNLARTSR